MNYNDLFHVKLQDKRIKSDTQNKICEIKGNFSKILQFAVK